MIKPVCPRCTTSLERRSNGHILQYVCPTCSGFGAHFGALRRLTKPADAKQIWLKSESAPTSELSCGFCRKHMRQILLEPEAHVELDLCRACHVIWFDFGEWEAAGGTTLTPARSEPMVHADPMAREHAKAILELKRQEADAQNWGLRNAYPDSTWKVAAAFCGLPVEEKSDRFAADPYLTWLLIVACILSTFWGLKHQEYVLNHLAYHAQSGILLGAIQTFTHFFFHAGILHLVGNMYSLWVFGDNVEDELGKEGFLALVALSTLAGCLVYAKFDPHAAQVPALGASGGIFGIIVYYLIKFPHRKFIVDIGGLRRLRWIHFITVPAWAFGLLYLILPQIPGVFSQMHGDSRVSYLSHLGGGIVGFAFAVLRSKNERDQGVQGSGRA